MADNNITYSSSIEVVDPGTLFTDGYELSNQNVIENEYHFLLVCQAYRQLRMKYLKPYFCSFPTLNKFDILMTSNSKITLLNIAKHLLHANKLRSELLNQ